MNCDHFDVCGGCSLPRMPYPAQLTRKRQRLADLLHREVPPLVPSPVSKLLTLRAPLVTSAGKSAILAVADADAVMLEDGRSQLATLFDMDVFTGLTGVSRDNLVYCFAFAIPGQP